MRQKIKSQKKAKRKVKEQFIPVNDIRCPVCDGIINQKWFNFANNNVVDFIAECWNPESAEHHIFHFQLAMPETLLIKGKGSRAFRGDRD